jgi:uncharacterized protein (TIGR00297 family)
MSVIENLAIVLALCALLSLISYKFGLLTPSGSAASFVMGVIIGVFGSVNWLIMLIAFALAGFVVTRYKIDVKMKNGLQEGKKGERTYKNVFANAFVPALIAVISYAAGMQNQPIAVLAYLCSISVAAADTIASELGVLSSRTYMITTGKPCKPGTNGGVSALGTGAALGAAVYTSAVGWAVLLLFSGQLAGFPLWFILLPVAMGFLGCQIDSVLGATLENRGMLNKDRVNILSIGAATLLALALMTCVGW